MLRYGKIYVFEGNKARITIMHFETCRRESMHISAILGGVSTKFYDNKSRNYYREVMPYYR